MVKVIWTQYGARYDLSEGQLAQDDGLSSLVILMLFTDARANESDELPNQSTDRKGWPGNTYSDFEWGSRLWLLMRRKITTETKSLAKEYATEALKPLVNYGYAKRYIVTATRTGAYQISLAISITKPDDSELSYEAALRWENTINEVF
ncbi:phage GP46 family protein [Vibrio sp. LaRot3]|uniref:phage GP46 family protein n=1 Tax=Vibrio sp. LaRot3 TaxID=2998829 RepID=UPI0022CE0FF6|nr:phage GP46 family protein [Vibrio sp. LaRot3]MDA0148862.1 phage GP46 family protein [Vibrio sp. LaRot3]